MNTEQIHVGQFDTEVVSIDQLKPHPRNYAAHPDDQLEHIIQSIRDNGIYRNIVVARDYTILAGHGVVMAARKMGLIEVPVLRLPLDPNEPKALKVVIGDNEITHLREVDDRLLSEMLREVRDVEDVGLLGTGYDDKMLMNLIYVTRPSSEVADFNEAAEWVGMPDYDPSGPPLKVTVSFRNNEDRMKFAALVGENFTDKTKAMWWPHKDQDDLTSLRFEA